jgi:hypothetical protein
MQVSDSKGAAFDPRVGRGSQLPRPSSGANPEGVCSLLLTGSHPKGVSMEHDDRTESDRSETEAERRDRLAGQSPTTPAPAPTSASPSLWERIKAAIGR